VEVAIVVIAIGVTIGALTGLVVSLRSMPDLDDPHLRRRTIRRALAEHPLARRLARAVPDSVGAALTEGIIIAATIVALTSFVAGAVLVMIRTGTGFALVDEPVAEWAAEQATAASTDLMGQLTKFGGTEYIVIAAISTALVAWWRDRRAAVVLFVLTTMIGQFLVSNSIKWTVDRARPTLSNLTGFSGTSFPSGHAVAAAAVWTSVAFLLGRGRSRGAQGVLFGLAVGLGVIVAGTRVALGVHWTTDVVVGLLIGWAWFAVSAVLFGGRRLEPAEPLLVASSEEVSARVGSPAPTRATDQN
jgi:membrane-associated phospholipid phosphatase